MCGIAGAVNLHGNIVEQQVLTGMAESLAHRGPDGQGIWREANVGLAHRRLSILDLSDNGHQPMCSLDGRFVLCYNGEIYNYPELKEELVAKGYHFQSTSDTEVLLNSLIEWGPTALNKFNGMFAFALFDRETGFLLLARDRYGIKPLYYSIQKGLFCFASEQKAITGCEHFSESLDKEALLEYLTFQNIFTHKTLLKDIHLFPPGHYAIFDTRKTSASLQLKQYWDFHFQEPEQPLPQKAYQEELEYLIRKSIQRQLRSDVELGTYLSGGMDSGSITAIAAQELPYVKTFTCGFDLHSASGLELAFDEREKAEFMSYLFKTEHYEMVLKAGDMERCLPSLVNHLEEPRVGQSYPNFYAAKLASKFVKVVLNGTGGDEIFGGYPWRYYRAAVSDNFEQFINKYYDFWQRMLADNERKKLIQPIAEQVQHVDTKEIFRSVFAHHDEKFCRPEDYVNHCLYFEAKTFMHGLLVVEDKLSMAHSLESRVPMLDNELVDFAMRCPVSLKLNSLSEVARLDENEPGTKSQRYFQKTKDGKQILRDAMQSILPHDITNATKQGFSAPDASWFKGESIDFVQRSILNPQSSIFEVLDFNTTRRLVTEHLEGKSNRRLLLWSLLYLHTYLS